MMTLHELMTKPSRQIAAKLVINFLNPFQVYSSTITTPLAHPYMKSSQLSNQIITAGQKWFAFGDNKLNGSYYLLPETENLLEPQKTEVGWWSKEISDGQGEFTTPLVFRVSMTAQPVTGLSIVGDALTNNYPRHFKVEMFNAGNELIYTREVIDNNKIAYTDVFLFDNVTQYIITIYSINKAFNHLKLIEMGTDVTMSFDRTMLMSINTLEELTYDSFGLPLGAVSANEIDFEINNIERIIDLESESSIFKSLLTKNKKMQLQLGVKDSNGEYVWVNYGTFYASDNWNFNKNQHRVSGRGLDVLEILTGAYIEMPEVLENKSLHYLFDYVLSSFPLLSLNYEISTTLQSIIIPYCWFDRITYREAVNLLAGLADVMVWTDRNGVIQVKAVEEGESYPNALTESNQITSSGYPNRLNASANSLQAKVYKYAWGSEESIYKNDSTITLAVGETQKINIQYNAVPIKNARIVCSNMALISNIEYFVWGCKITLTNNTGSAASITSLEIFGVPLQPTGTQLVTVEDGEGIALNGVLSVPLYDNYLLQNTADIRILLQELLDVYKYSQMDLLLNTKGHLGIAIGNNLPVTVSGVTKQYAIKRIDTSWSGALKCTLNAVDYRGA